MTLRQCYEMANGVALTFGKSQCSLLLFFKLLNVE